MERQPVPPPPPFRRLTRRQMVARGAQFAGVLSLGGLLSACGDSADEAASTTSTTSTTAAESEPLSGTITMQNYPGWMGKTEVADFQKANPDVTVKEVEGASGGTAATVNQIRQNEGTYDMTLGGLVIAGHLNAAGLIEKVNPDNIPNLANVPDFIREAYPYGIPTDYGQVGIGYRKDLMSEQPTSWADLWALAPKYDKKIVFLGHDAEVIGTTLIYLGFSNNSEDPDELEQAKQAILEIKPHVRAFAPTNVTRAMLEGSAVATLGYDYDIAAAQQQNDNIVWVAPEEGTHAYLDGWAALKGTDNLDEIEAFMNFHLEPEVYADFINNTGSAYILPAAEPFIKKSIAKSSSLGYDEAALKAIHWSDFVGAEATELRSKIWQEIQAA